MKLKRLALKNIRCIRDLDLEVPPEAPVIYVTGPNGIGKTSLLDGILMALAGKKKIPAGSITNGCESAVIEVETDEGLKIERKITEKGAYLKVFRADGSEAPSPQKLLDRILGPISMEPWAFISGTAKSRRDLILASAGVEEELGDLEVRDKDAREERRLAKRSLKETEAQLKDAPPLMPGTPDEPVDTSELKGVLREAHQIQQNLERADQKLRTLEEEEKRLIARLDEIARESKKIDGWIAEQGGPVVEDAQKNLDEAEEINRLVAESAGTRMLMDQKKTQGDRVSMLEARVGKIEGERKALLGRIAEALPVEGLAVDDNEVLVNEIPFPQLSTAQRLKVAVALATKEDPELRVVRITDGSVLDKSSREYLDAVARDEGLQIWVEDVRETGTVGLELTTEA